MKKIALCIHDDTISFKYRAKKIEKSDLLNTNIIYDNELVFSDEYIIQNKEIVSLFLLDLYNDYNIRKFRFSCNEIADIVLDTFKYLPKIELITLKEDTFLTYSLYEKIVQYNNVKEVSCYSIPAFIVELLDKKNIKSETRSEMLFTSSFMEINGLQNYGQLYYKNNVSFRGDLSTDDINEFKVFCNVNKYLKVIQVDKYSSKNIMAIVQVLYSVRKKGIVIEIHDDINDEEQISNIVALNKKLKKKYKISLSLVYSKEYLEKNYSKQVIITTLKYCSIIIFALIGCVLLYLLYNNFKSQKDVDMITDDLKSLLTEEYGQYEEVEDPYLNLTPPEDEQVPTPDVPNEPQQNQSIYVNNYDRLLAVNTDTVGWITVNNTKVDYPVVRSYNNDYYLTHNYYKKFTYNGWIFMDYRNNPKYLDKNTILYGHNRFDTGVMFGTLQNVLKKSWYTNENNLIITFNTLYEKISWKVFSIYTIDVTSDYLQNTFKDDQEYQDFIDMISNRSEIKFNTEVTVNDKILTLSTCHDQDKRLVVHAVRMN